MAEETTTQETTEATTTDESTGEITETLYLDGKYKSVSDLENGYRELNKSYTQKTQEFGSFQGAPEEYTYNEGVEASDFATKWGKENQLSNDGLNSLVDGYNKYQEEQIVEYQNTQLEALGENGKERIQNVNDYLNANLGEDHGLDVDSAKGVEALERLISSSKQAAPVSRPTAPSANRDDIREMRFAKDEYGNRKMSSDPAYRAKIEALEREMLGA
jgi:hypothetical protein